MILILPSQATVLNAYAVLVGMTPGYAAFKDHQAYIAASSTAAYKTALEGLFTATSTATLATSMLTNLGLTATFTQAQAEAFLAANPGNRVGAMMDLASALYVYSGADVGLASAKAAYVNAVDTSYAYSNNEANKDGKAWVGVGGQTVSLTTGFDNVMGTALSDTFLARTIGNSNTLNDRDMVDGGAGNDTLFVDFTSLTNAITPVLKNIETVVIRAQTTTADATNGNNLTNATVQLDAQRSLAVDNYDHVTAATGVTRWESNNSRSDVIIEDVRIGNSQKTKDITIAMVETDPGNVDFGVYFDQLSLRNTGTSNSSINIQLMDTGAAAGYQGADTTKPLLNNPYDTFKFLLNGVQVAINLNPTGSTTVASSADTYAQLLAAFQVALTGTGVTASLGADFSLVDPLSTLSVTGKTIVLTGGGATISTNALSGWYNTLQAPVPADANIYNKFTSGSTGTTELVTSTVVLDDVGRGSTGGDLVIGGLSVGESSTSRGVERFEITVNDNSKLQTINSTNNALREVTIVNGTTSNTVADAYTTTTTNSGNLTVNGNAKTSLGADQGGDPGTAPITGNQTMAGVNEGATATHQGANAAGFTDVRLINASTMTGKLAFTAAITSDSIAKYVNLVDTATSPTADVASTGSGNVNMNVLGANFEYSGGSGADTMTVTIDAAAAASRSTVVSGQSDMTFVMDGGAGADVISVRVNTDAALNGNLQNWYNNQDLNNNITINGGDGADTISKPGAGDTTIDAGGDADTVYAENTGRQTGLNAGTGTSVTALATGTSSNGIWVFNTYDQANAVANGAARNIYDIRSDVNNTYNFYKAGLVVTFKGVPQAATITLANTSTYTLTDFEINQGIKLAINGDATLSKLLLAQDGPGSSLIVTSKIDGTMATGDLSVALTQSASSTWSAAELTAAAAAYTITTGATVAASTAAVDAVTALATTAYGTTNLDYQTQMAQDAAGVNITGANSTATSDNFISPGTGNDVIVLGTAESLQDVGRSSNDVITFAASFGNDVIVNFDNDGFGIDHLNLYAFLDTTTTVTLSGTSGGAATWTAGKSVVNLMAEVTAAGATQNTTAALLQALFRAGAGDTTTASNQVIIVVNAHNVGTVYSVVNGTAAADAVVTLQGSIDLGLSTWNTVANYYVPVASNAVPLSTVTNRTIASEGPNAELVGTTLTAVAASQVLVGTANIDTFNTGGFTGVSMTGAGSGDLFVVTTGSTGSIITDLVTGDDFTVAGTGALTATISTSGFTASAATVNNSTNNTLVNLTSVVGGGVAINMALATGATGYTLTGSAAGVNTLTGSANADVITGAAGGTNTMSGGLGNDTITGGAGVDTVNVTAGVDAIGGFGSVGDIITVSAGAIANLTPSAIWAATAGSSNAGALNVILGVAGVDLSLMTGANGATITEAVGANAFTQAIVGSINADVITINAASTGNDVIAGGKGNDTITLATAATTDTVRYAALDGVDTVVNFLAGTDIFDYTSGLVATTGATAIAAGAITGTMISIPATSVVTLISAAAATVAAFEFDGGNTNRLAVDFATASAATIQTAAEAIMNGNIFATGTAPMTNGAIGTDVLFVMYETTATAQGATADAAIFRYQEGAAAEASYSGELTLVAVLTGVAADALTAATVI